MANPRDTAVVRDRILIVESDPVISDLIGRQALKAVGYQVQIATDATSAIARALQWSPDLILADLNLPGLSGKDLMVALASQGIQTPLIVIAQRGSEADIIQTFRLGAADYLLLPAREAEVVNAVNRVLRQVHERRERERLAQQLQATNQELQSRVRELTTLFALGKAMNSVTDHGDLLEKILEGAARITQADLGWFLLRDDERPFVVAAMHNLPSSLGVRLHQPWDDGISSLVAMSGETLTIHGEPIRRFKISSLGQSALIVPIKVQKKVIGLLVMMRRQPAPFGASEQNLLGALADYASVSLVNARLFRTTEDRARALQQVSENSQVAERVNNDLLRVVKRELAGPSAAGLAALEQLGRDATARWRPDQRQLINVIQEGLTSAMQISEAIPSGAAQKVTHERVQANLVEMAKQSVQRLQPYAQRCGVNITPELPSGSVLVLVDGDLMAKALDGLLGDAIRHTPAGGSVSLRLEKTTDNQARLSVRSGRALNTKDVERVFADTDPQPVPGRFSGLTVRLGLVREIAIRHGGKMVLESHSARSTDAHIFLPLARA